MKIGDFGMSRQVIMKQDGMCLERAMSANVIGTAAYSTPELLLADSPVKQNRVDAGTVLKSDVSFLEPVPSIACMLWRIMQWTFD